MGLGKLLLMKEKSTGRSADWMVDMPTVRGSSRVRVSERFWLIGLNSEVNSELAGAKVQCSKAGTVLGLDTGSMRSSEGKS